MIRLGPDLRPAWMDRAACRTAPQHLANLAFGPADEQKAFIRAYCSNGCPVREECLTAGADEQGVWGGMTQKTRSGRLGGRLAERTRKCGTRGRYQQHVAAGERCAVCSEANRVYSASRRAG